MTQAYRAWSDGRRPANAILHKHAMPSWLTAAKRVIAAVIQSQPIGRAIGRLYRDVIPFHGLPIDVRGAGIPAANKAALWWGMYESAEYRFVRAFLRSDLPVVELGSSIGAISSVIARKLAPGQRLTCVEANPTLLATLERNVRNNGSHLTVEVLNAAVAYDSESVRFGVSSDNLASSISDGAKDLEVVVPGTTLSKLIAALDAGPYQLVADIEGAEAAIFLHDADALRACRRIVIELHESCYKGTVYTTAHLIRLLEAAGYTTVARYGEVIACEREEPR